MTPSSASMTVTLACAIPTCSAARTWSRTANWPKRRRWRILTPMPRSRRRTRTPPELLRGIVRTQESDGGLEHLQARRAGRQPVILVLQGHQRDRLAGALEGTLHDIALLERHH